MCQNIHLSAQHEVLQDQPTAQTEISLKAQHNGIALIKSLSNIQLPHRGAICFGILSGKGGF
jgi:hypothetical protein